MGADGLEQSLESVGAWSSKGIGFAESDGVFNECWKVWSSNLTSESWFTGGQLVKDCREGAQQRDPEFDTSCRPLNKSARERRNVGRINNERKERKKERKTHSKNWNHQSNPCCS